MDTKNRVSIGFGEFVDLSECVVADGSHYPNVIYSVPQDPSRPYHVYSHQLAPELADVGFATLQDARDCVEGR